jgi:hypothetical protein
MKMAEEIKKLHELKEKGILTEEEFTLAKKKIIEIIKEEESSLNKPTKKLLLG